MRKTGPLWIGMLFVSGLTAMAPTASAHEADCLVLSPWPEHVSVGGWAHNTIHIAEKILALARRACDSVLPDHIECNWVGLP